MQSRPFRGRYVMTIAVSSQNRKTVTAHAGKCRRFWLYRVVDTEVRDKRLIELAASETFHEHHDAGVHPLNGINVLIAGGAWGRPARAPEAARGDGGGDA